MSKIGLENELFHEIETGLPEGIVKSRVLYLLKWYRKKAQRYKFITYMATTVSILFPAVLALLNSQALSDCLPVEWTERLRVVLPILGSAGAAIYAFLQSKDNWIRYRTAVEQIKRETVYYIAKYGDGKPIDTDAEEAFLNTIEKIGSSELTEWRRNRMETVPDAKERADSEDHPD